MHFSSQKPPGLSQVGCQAPGFVAGCLSLCQKNPTSENGTATWCGRSPETQRDTEVDRGDKRQDHWEFWGPLKEASPIPEAFMALKQGDCVSRERRPQVKTGMHGGVYTGRWDSGGWAGCKYPCFAAECLCLLGSSPQAKTRPQGGMGGQQGTRKDIEAVRGEKRQDSRECLEPPK